MSEKQAEKKDKKLLDALQEEAKEIEKRAESYQGQHLTQGDKDDMYLKIMERLKEMGELEKDEEKESEATGTDGAVVMPMPKKKPVKKPLWRQIVKCAGILLVAGSVVFATSLISEGNRMYWIEKWQSLFPGSKVVTTDNDTDRILNDLTEQEIREKIESEMGMPMPRFLYWPEGTKYLDASVSIEQKTVRLDYEYNNNIIYLLVTGSENDISESKMSQLAKSEEIIIDIKNNKVPVTLIADDTGTNGTIIYRGQWKYANCLYELSGIIEKEEMIKVLKKVRYNV